MSKKHQHPGVYLNELMKENSLTQRSLASKLDIAHSLLNNILNANRNVNISIALALEAAGFGDADDWLKKQLRYSLSQAKLDKELMKKNELIKTWNELDGKWLPLSYFKKQKLGIDSPDDLDKIYSIYEVSDFDSLKRKIEDFPLMFFRKSNKFQEIRENVIAWSVLAEYLAKKEKVEKFNPSKKNELLSELQVCLYKNDSVLKKTKSILSKYGIKFLILDKPIKTPVEGKSFISLNNPTIALTLKYKRLDNFIFGLYHELGHVFLHLTQEQYKSANFYVGNSKNNKLEFEADNFARNNLIDIDIWNNFLASSDEYDDDEILAFSREIKIPPTVIRGRLCHEGFQSYSKRTKLNKLNFIG